MESAKIAHDQELIPPIYLMKNEGIDVLEDWFRWAEEWSVFLRLFGKITADSKLLEIGCGLGRIAFPLRYVLSARGLYEGFDICAHKIQFLTKTFHKAYPHFRFSFANIKNSFYNPEGQISASDYFFPFPDNSFDVVLAASVFTHMLPESTRNYFRQSARVLNTNGRCIFSFFLFDNYQAGQPRPLGFARPDFNFDHRYKDYGDEFGIADPCNPEKMTAYSQRLIERYAVQAGLRTVKGPLSGLWSGSSQNWVATQDLMIFQKC